MRTQNSVASSSLSTMGRLSSRTLLFGGPAVALLVALVAVFLSGSISSREEPCGTENADDILFFDEKQVNPCLVFSETYNEARAKFRVAARQQPTAKLFSYHVYEDYATDIAVIPGSLPGLVVHTSGVHGVEGYAGSAIQIAWLQTSHDGDIPTVVLVHAVNPYGMAKYRRVDQDNVDLNRNAMHSWGDDIQPLLERNSKLYSEFEESLFYPKNQEPTLMDVKVLFLWHAVMGIVRHGYSKLKAAMVTGQYNSPRGVFYGGSKLQPSHELLYNFMKDTVLPSINLQGDAPVTWIDIHTGLGKVQGMDTLLSFSDDREKEPSLSQEVGRHFVNASIQDESVAAGYEWVLGTTDSFYSSLFEKSWRLSQEFGTIPSIAVAKALVLENMAEQFFGSEKPKVWSDLLRKAFYPHTKIFRKNVLQRGMTVLEQATTRR